MADVNEFDAARLYLKIAQEKLEKAEAALRAAPGNEALAQRCEDLGKTVAAAQMFVDEMVAAMKMEKNRLH